MKKFFVNQLVIAVVVISAVFMSCGKSSSNDRKDECVCVLRNAEGVFMGYGTSNEVKLDSLIFFMYPNPASYMVTIEFKTMDFHTVTITDKRGRVLFQSFTQYTLMINISDYPADMYRVTVENGEHKNTLCLIKKD